MNEWFYEDAGQAHGPVSKDNILSFLKQLGDWRTVLVWKEGFTDWKQAVEVVELSTRLTCPPPLPKPRSPATSVPEVGARSQRSELLSDSSVEAAGSIPADEPTKKKGSWVLKALGWVGLFVVAALAKGIGGEFGKAVSTPSRAEQIEATLSKAEALARAQLPKKLDDITTLVAVDHEGNRLRFHYRVDGGIPVGAIETIRSNALSDVCAKRTTNGLDGGIAFEYLYQDQQSKPLGSYMVAKNDCKAG